MSNGLIIRGGGSHEMIIGGKGITVIDNLNSDSATDALSAKQGKALNEAKQEKIVAGANITIGADEKTISADLSSKQDVLISGTNIKTINNESVVGSGNITITGTGEMNVLEGVQIGGTDLTIDANKKVNIPIANDTDKGVVKTNLNYGIQVNSGTDELYIFQAIQQQIDKRNDTSSASYAYRNYQPIVCGNLDYAVRSVRPSTATSLPESGAMSINTIYTLDTVGTVLGLYLPSDGQIGDFIEINFAIGSTPATVTFICSAGMYISDYDATTEANKAYTYFCDWGAIVYGSSAPTLGWRISRAEYELPPSTT